MKRCNAKLMLVKYAYPKSSNLQTQNPELPVIWSEPQTVVDSLKQLLVILNLWWFLCYE